MNSYYASKVVTIASASDNPSLKLSTGLRGYSNRLGGTRIHDVSNICGKTLSFPGQKNTHTFDDYFRLFHFL